MRLAVSKSRWLKGSSTPAYKGAWRGHNNGIRADTIWSPRLSPMRVLQGNPPWACLRIRHELLRPVSAMGFQQLGRPVGNPPYHPDGPPWHAGLGLRRWYIPLWYIPNTPLPSLPHSQPPFIISSQPRMELVLKMKTCRLEHLEPFEAPRTKSGAI
jgi:hypothetical protein